MKQNRTFYFSNTNYLYIKDVAGTNASTSSKKRLTISKIKMASRRSF